MKDTTGTHLATTAQLTAGIGRWVAHKLELFVNGTWVDRTADCIDWQLVREREIRAKAVPTRTSGKASTFTVHLRNWSSVTNTPIYAPQVTSGPLGSGLANGLYLTPIRISAGFYYVRGGIIQSPSPSTALSTGFTDPTGYWNGSIVHFNAPSVNQSWEKLVTNYDNGVATVQAFPAGASSGDTFWIGRPELLRQFTGVVAEVPNNLMAKRELTLTCYGPGERINRKKVNLSIYTRMRIDQWEQKIAEYVGLVDGVDFVSLAYAVAHPGVSATFEAGYHIVPSFYEDFTDVGTAWDVTATSEAASRFYDDNGLLCVHAASHGEYDPTTLGPPVPAYTFYITSASANCEDIQAKPDPKAQAQRIVVEHTPRIQQPITVVFTLDEALKVPPSRAGVPGVRNFMASFSDPVSGIRTPQARVDYYATFAGGFDVTLSLSVSLDASATWARKANILFTNNNPNTEIIPTYCVLRAYPWQGQPTKELKLDLDVPPAITLLEMVEVRGNEVIQTQEQVDFLSAYLKAFYIRPHTTFTIYTGCVPFLEEHDLVLVTDVRQGYTNVPCRITRTEQRYNSPTGKYQAVYTCIDVDVTTSSNPYFIFGHATYGRLKTGNRAFF